MRVLVLVVVLVFVIVLVIVRVNVFVRVAVGGGVGVQQSGGGVVVWECVGMWRTLPPGKFTLWLW